MSPFNLVWKKSFLLYLFICFSIYLSILYRCSCNLCSKVWLFSSSSIYLLLLVSFSRRSLFLWLFKEICFNYRNFCLRFLKPSTDPSISKMLFFSKVSYLLLICSWSYYCSFYSIDFSCSFLALPNPTSSSFSKERYRDGRISFGISILKLFFRSKSYSNKE